MIKLACFPIKTLCSLHAGTALWPLRGSSGLNATFQSHQKGLQHCCSSLTLFRHLNIPLCRQGSLYISFFTVEKNSIIPQIHPQGKFSGRLQFVAETAAQPGNKATPIRRRVPPYPLLPSFRAKT